MICQAAPKFNSKMEIVGSVYSYLVLVGNPQQCIPVTPETGHESMIVSFDGQVIRVGSYMFVEQQHSVM